MRISKSNYINDIDYQKQIIDSFPEPQSDYDRVDFNYLVLRKVKGISVKRLIFEVASVFAIPILLVFSISCVPFWLYQYKPIFDSFM